MSSCHPCARARRTPRRGALACALAAAVVATAIAALPTAQAQSDSPSQQGPRAGERPLFENWPDGLAIPEEFDGERLSEETRRAVESLLAMVGPMLEQLSFAIRDLPRYEPPVILPNGDILIRRIPSDGRGPNASPKRSDPDPDSSPGEAPRPNQDGSYDL